MPTPSRGNLYMLFVLVFPLLISDLIQNLFVLGIVPQHIIYYIAFGQLAFIVPLIIYCIFNRRKLAEVLPFRKINFINIAFIIMITIVTEPLAIFLGYLSSFFFPNTVGNAVTTMAMEFPLPIVIFFTCLMPAIWEELTLRGIVFGHYQQISIQKAALINGLFFGIFHMDLHQFLYAFMMGFIFCYFVRYTQSLWSAMLAHFIFNFTQTLWMYWLIRQMDTSQPYEPIIEMQFSDKIAVLASYSIFAAIFLPVFFILFYTFIAYNKRRLFQEAMRLPYIDEDKKSLPLHLSFEPKTFDLAFWMIISLYIAYHLDIFL